MPGACPFVFLDASCWDIYLLHVAPFLVHRLGRVLMNNESLPITQEPPRPLTILYLRIDGEGLYFNLYHALSQVVLIQPDQA